MELETSQEFQPDRTIFTCYLCQKIFEKPVTLACGHTYCLYCIRLRLENESKSDVEEKFEQNVVPVCPQCGQIIWRFTLE